MPIYREVRFAVRRRFACRVDGSAQPALRDASCGGAVRLASLLLPGKVRRLVSHHSPRLQLGEAFNQRFDAVRFPPGLRSLIFLDGFNQSLDNAIFPSNLQILDLGDSFNHGLDRVAFPTCLQELRLSADFDKCLDSVTFPSCLRVLTNGEARAHSPTVL